MKKLFPVFFFFFGMLNLPDLKGQVFGNFIYSDTFTTNVTYCPNDRQYDDWGKFRSKLDTTNFKILKVTMKGSYSSSGRVCTDSFTARKLAAALKNPPTGSSYSINCNGNVWVVSYPGSCLSGCAQTADNVGIGADGSTNACSCLNPSWQLRPTIGNSNWGGVNSLSCNPSPTQRMTIEFEYRLYPIDASVISVNQIDLCNNPNNIIARIKNSGSKTLDSLRVNWSLNGVNQAVTFLKKIIQPAKDTILTLKKGLNLTPYTSYEIKVWTSKPNGVQDQYTRNDTVVYKFRYTGSPNTPDARDTTLCGTGYHTLIGRPYNKNDSLLWFDSKTSTSILGVGSKFRTAFLSKGKYKYFISAASQLLNTSIETNFAGVNQQAGFMLDIKAIQGSSIDSLAINLGASASTNANIEVYYRDGGYSGYETNSSAWTLLGKYNVLSKGPGVPTIIPAKFSLPTGKTYGIYVQTTNAPSFYLAYGNGSFSYNDGILQINTGAGILLNWGGTFAARNGNIRFYYKKPTCLSERDSMILTVNSKPTGAALIKGVPFNSPDLLTLGTSSNPDIVGVGKELNYELQAPTGYYNLGFGITWTITDLKALKASGKSIPNYDTAFSFPGPSKNGKLRFIPGANLEDSLISVYLTIKDISGNKCDSILQRKIYIAPVPKINFSATTVCNGTPVFFKNMTTIRSGAMSYKWDFGNGDSSNTFEPVYLYPSFGIYNVKLTAKTNWGITKDTIIKVTVNEIPDIKFKVLNACFGDSLSFVNSTTISTGTVSYKWFFGDSKTSNKISPKYIYAKAGDYIVTLLANANNCNSSLSKKANQFVRPVANFNVTGNCSKSPVYFKNLTTIGLGENFGSNWTFDQDGGNNETSPNHIFDTPGLKTIRYVAISQFGCLDSMTKTIVIVASPEAKFTNGQVCNVRPVVFNNISYEPNGVLTSYIWGFGDGIFSNLKNPQHNYPETGKKIVRLTALGNNGCSTYEEKAITVLLQPIANFEALDACIGENVIFTNRTKGSGVINFRWKFGDGDSSSIFSPVKKYMTKVASTYNVTLIAKNVGGCQDVITIPVNVRETPSCGFTFKSAGTGGLEYIFIPDVKTYPFYQWTFQGGGSSNDISPRFKFDVDGKYRVTVSMKNVEGCDCLDSTHFVSVNRLSSKPLENKSGIYLYPNPNSGAFSIIIEKIQPNELFTLNIIDITGRVLHSKQLLGNKLHSLSYHEIANGIYTIEVLRSSGERITAKLNIVK